MPDDDPRFRIHKDRPRPSSPEVTGQQLLLLAGIVGLTLVLMCAVVGYVVIQVVK